KGEVLRAQKRYEEAIPEYERVLAFDRNSASALLALGHCKLMIGSIEELIPLVEQASRLSPRDPKSPSCITGLGKCICCNPAPIRRSHGWRRRAAPIPNFSTFTPFSPPPMPSKARPNAPPPNLPKPGDWSPTIVIQASPS